MSSLRSLSSSQRSGAVSSSADRYADRYTDRLAAFSPAESTQRSKALRRAYLLPATRVDVPPPRPTYVPPSALVSELKARSLFCLLALVLSLTWQNQSVLVCVGLEPVLASQSVC